MNDEDFRLIFHFKSTGKISLFTVKPQCNGWMAKLEKNIHN